MFKKSQKSTQTKHGVVNKKAGFCIVGLFIFLFTTFCLYTNFFGVAHYSSINMRQDGSSELVVNRIMKSRQDGIFSNAGLMMYHKTYIDEWANDYLSHSFVEEEFQIYGSQIGLQGTTASVLDAILPLDDLQILQLLRLLDCAAMALMLTILMLWLWREFCFGAAFTVMIVAVFSSWINGYAFNFYWVIWTLFLPFIALLVLHMLEERFAKRPWGGWVFFLASLFCVFIRAACGYEYITTVLVALEVGVVYYVAKNGWGKKQYIRRSFWVGAGGVAGFFIAVCVNMLQKTIYYGSFQKAWEYLVGDIYKRTGLFLGAGEQLYERVGVSFNAPLTQVLKSYISEGEPLVFYETMQFFILLFVLGIALYFISERVSPTIAVYKLRIRGLLLATGVSFLAPLSWFILAKAHSYFHGHVNYLLWFVPTVFLIVGLIGALAQMLLQDFSRAHKAPFIRTVAVFVAAFMFIWPIYCQLQVWEYPKTTRQLTNVLQQGSLLYQDGNNNIYYYDGQLYFFVPKRYNTNAYYFCEVYSEKETVAMDAVSFAYQDYEMIVPFWKTYRVATLPVAEGGDAIFVGQSRDDAVRIWEANLALK